MRVSPSNMHYIKLCPCQCACSGEIWPAGGNRVTDMFADLRLHTVGTLTEGLASDTLTFQESFFPPSITVYQRPYVSRSLKH